METKQPGRVVTREDVRKAVDALFGETGTWINVKSPDGSVVNGMSALSVECELCRSLKIE